MQEKMWRLRDVAGMLDCDYQTTWRWTQSGLLRTVKLPGGALRVKDSEIQRILREQSIEKEPVTA